MQPSNKTGIGTIAHKNQPGELHSAGHVLQNISLPHSLPSHFLLLRF